MAASTLTPVTVLTGFLGAGKTTLLARMLQSPAASDTAVIVNELGEVPLDHVLLRNASGEIAVLGNGCVCCSVANELTATLRELFFRRAEGKVPPFRRVVIETTGLADPAPILYTLIQLPVVVSRYALSGVVTVVDALHGMGQLDAHVEAVRQVAMADRLVLSKTDQADAATLAALTTRLRAMNPAAPLHRVVQGDIDPTLLLDAGLYRLDDRPPDVQGWLAAEAYRAVTAVAAPLSPARAPAPTARHDARVQSFVVRFEQPVEWPLLEDALHLLFDVRGASILRMKGLVNVAGEAGPTVLHAVQHTLYPPVTLPDWPAGFTNRASQLVFIVQDLPPEYVYRSLKACVGDATYNDPRATRATLGAT